MEGHVNVTGAVLISDVFVLAVTLNGAMHLVNSAGIALSFLAFWFGAPEIIGEARLARAAQVVVSERVAQLLGVTAAFAFLIVFFIVSFVPLVHPTEGPLPKLLHIPIWTMEVYWLILALTSIAGAIRFAREIGNKVDTLIRKAAGYLSEAEDLRRVLLVIGAALFVVGTTCQFLASFYI